MIDPDWMRRAEGAARSLGAASVGTRGALHHVYVILLHRPAHSQPWGLYVGQTSLDPDLRFDQHRAGYKASRAVKRYGVRLLPDLVAHLNPLAGWDALDLEEALANALRDAGILWVEGGH